MPEPRRVTVTGAAGFIGSHLVEALKRTGHWVRAVDVRAGDRVDSLADEALTLDLREKSACEAAVEGCSHVYSLAADMGGMGYLTGNSAQILRSNALIDINLIEAARCARVQRYFYASSACVYPEGRQDSPGSVPLREEDAYPADPSDGYGWEKLMGERLCDYYRAEHELDVRIARFHNIFGPRSNFRDGREKAPAAICRKVIEAPTRGVVEVWGDGHQRRSFCFITDCVRAVQALMASGYQQPVNIGSDRSISIGELAQLAIEIGGRADLTLTYVPGPQGVRGRNADIGLARRILGWEPEVSLEEGLTQTYAWIERELGRAPEAGALHRR